MPAYKLACGHVAALKDAHAVGDTVNCPVEYVQVVITEDMSAPPAVPSPNGTMPERSYGCSWGCGNPYDYIMTSVVDATTEFLCLVCFLKLAQDMIMAVLNPDDPAVRAAMTDSAALEHAPMTSGKVRKRGKNAPADTDDDDLIEAFDSRITSDELGEEFK